MPKGRRKLIEELNKNFAKLEFKIAVRNARGRCAFRNVQVMSWRSGERA